ncbi:MAG TPA: GNAT family N-acetyltransferase [Candidatus Absconditabacterales bacterium]|nr:GNAT family N-acetyltransferase [Candidatus Absconditabacterales bacterium]
MKSIHKLTIETERLLLVPITMEYAEEIFKEFTPEITTYMFPKSAEHISETERFIQESIEKMLIGNNYQTVILDKLSKEFLGCVGLHIENPLMPELGIWIKKSAFGKKIGREAVAGVTNRAQKNLEFEYLFYPVDQENIPSRKIAESIGGIVQTRENGEEIVHIKATLDPNKILHSVEYRIYKK